MNDAIITVADVTQSISIIIACWTAVAGIGAWRREFVGKRRIQLAEDVLEAFFKVRDAISNIRNPFSAGNEGSSRKQGNIETAATTELLNRAYIVVERYQKNEDAFRNFGLLKYRFMATFGKDAEAIFTQLEQTVNKIFVSARMLGSHYWPRQGRVQMTEQEFEKHLSEMHNHEAIFWDLHDGKDQIQKDLDEILGKLERVTAPVFEDGSGLYDILTKKLFRRQK